MIEKSKRRRILVIAGNYREFNDFCKFRLDDFEKGNEEFSGAEFIYYTREDAIRGMIFDEIIDYGTYYKRNDIDINHIFPSMRPKFSWWTYREKFYKE